MFLSTYILDSQQILCPESNNEDIKIHKKFYGLHSKKHKNYKIKYHISPFCFFIDKLLSLETDSVEARKCVNVIFKEHKINKDGIFEEEFSTCEIWMYFFDPIKMKTIDYYSNFREPLNAIISFEYHITDIYLVLNQLPLYRKGCKNTEYEIVKSYFNSLNFSMALDWIKQTPLREKCESIVNEWATKHKNAFEKAFELQKSKNEKTHKNDPDID
ncbi:hypothetical protein CDIK_2931 [Cucumispora dikerogammari]|nr:hypothetical protein CDIK_2931 [Cucumispora dikerogammari]